MTARYTRLIDLWGEGSQSCSSRMVGRNWICLRVLRETDSTSAWRVIVTAMAVCYCTEAWTMMSYSCCS